MVYPHPEFSQILVTNYYKRVVDFLYVVLYYDITAWCSKLNKDKNSLWKSYNSKILRYNTDYRTFISRAYSVPTCE